MKIIAIYDIAKVCLAAIVSVRVGFLFVLENLFCQVLLPIPICHRVSEQDIYIISPSILVISYIFCMCYWIIKRTG